VHRNAVDVVDEPPPFTAAARGCREDDDLMPTTDQARGKIMNLHLDSAQAGQIAVRQHRDLHRPSVA